MNRCQLCLRLWAALAAAVVLVGCASSSARMTRISPGMTKDEVVHALGRPHGVAAHGEVEYLTYNLLNKGVGDLREYAVKLVAGRVDSFGEKVDFGPNLLATNAPAGR
jgi:hypothetical protein